MRVHRIYAKTRHTAADYEKEIEVLQKKLAERDGTCSYLRQHIKDLTETTRAKEFASRELQDRLDKLQEQLNTSQNKADERV